MQRNISPQLMRIVEDIFQNRCSEFPLLDSRKTEITEQFNKYSCPQFRFQLQKYLTLELELSQTIAQFICSDFYQSSKLKKQSPQHNAEFVKNLVDQTQADLPFLASQSFEYIAKCLLLKELKNHTQVQSKFQSKISLQQFTKKLLQYKFDQRIFKLFEQLESLKPYQTKRIFVLSQISKLIEVLNLAEIRRYRNSSNLNKLTGKNTIMIIGKSGVGKTTFFLVAAGIQLLQPKTNQFQPADPLIAKDHKISSKALSQTRQVGFKQISSQFVGQVQMFALDTAGFDDNRSAQIDILNNLTTLNAVKLINSTRFAIFISSQMIGPRGDALKQFARTISHYFEDYFQVQDSIKFMLTKFDQTSIQKLEDIISSILKQTKNPQHNQQMWDNSNKNFISFFEHLSKQIQNIKDLLFHPMNSKPKQVMKYLLQAEPLQNPSGFIFTSYSVDAVNKIRQKGRHLQKMIELSFKKGQYNLTKALLQDLKYLQTLNQKKPLVQSYEKQKKWIQDELSNIPKSYENCLIKFFRNFDKDELEQAKKIKKNVQFVEMENIQKSPKIQIDQITSRKLQEIKQYFSSNKKQKIKKADTYCYACIYFLQMESPIMYNKVVQSIKQASQAIYVQLQNEMKLKCPSSQKLIQQFDSYMNEFRCDDTTQQNKYEIRYVQISSLLETILKLQFQHNKELLKIGYQFRFDQKTPIKIRQSLKKLDIIGSVHFKLQITTKQYSSKLLKQLKSIINFYISQNNRFTQDRQTFCFQKMNIYQQNYDTLMQIQALRNQSQITCLNYKAGIMQLLKKTLKRIDEQKTAIQTQMSSFAKQNPQKQFQSIQPKKIKKILQKMITSLFFLQKIGKQNNQKIKSVKSVVTQAQDIIFDFIKSIQNKANKYQIIDFQISKRLLIVFVITQEFSFLKINQQMNMMLSNIKQKLKQKMNWPLNNQKNRKKSTNSVYEWKNLQKLLNYYKCLTQKIDQIQDKSSKDYQPLIYFRKNQDLKDLVQKYFSITKEKFKNLQQYLTLTNEQRKNISKQQKIDDFVQYIKMYYIIENICKIYSSQLEAIDTFNSQDLNKYDIKKLVQTELKLIKAKVQQSQQFFVGSQLNQFEQNFNLFNNIYKESRKKLNQKQKQYLESQNQWVDIKSKIQEHRKRIRNSFVSVSNSVNQDLQLKGIDFKMSELKILAQSVGQAQGNLDQLKRVLKRVQHLIHQNLKALYDKEEDRTSEQLIRFIDKKCQFQHLLVEINSIVPNYPFKVDQSQFKDICQQYFKILYQQFQNLQRDLKAMKDVNKSMRIFDRKQSKILNLVPSLYQTFLLQKTKSTKQLRKQLYAYKQTVKSTISDKYLDPTTLTLDNNFHEFYKNTTSENRQQLKMKIVTHLKKQQKELNKLFNQDRDELINKINQIESTINLIPFDLRQNYCVIIQKARQKMQNQSKETLNKVNQLKNKNELKDIIEMAASKNKLNDKKAVKQVLSIFIDSLQTQKNSLSSKNTKDFDETIKNINMFKTDKNLKALQNQNSDIKIQIQDYQNQFKNTVKSKIIKVQKEVSNLIVKYQQKINKNVYKYSVLQNNEDCDANVNQIIGLTNMVTKNSDIFQNQFKKQTIGKVQKLVQNKIQDYLQTNQEMKNSCQNIQKAELSKHEIDQTQLKQLLCKSSIQIYLIQKIEEQFKKLQSQDLKVQKQDLKKIKDNSLLQKNIQNLIYYIQKLYKQVAQFDIASIEVQKADPCDINKQFVNKESKFRMLQKLIPIFDKQVTKIKQNYKEQIKQNIKNKFQSFCQEVGDSVEKSAQCLQYQCQNYCSFKNITEVMNNSSFSLFKIKKNVQQKINKKVTQKMDQVKKKVNEINSKESKQFIQKQICDIKDLKAQKKTKQEKFRKQGNVKLEQFRIQQQERLKKLIQNIDPACADKNEEQTKLKKNSQAQISSKKNDINTQIQSLVKKIHSQIDANISDLQQTFKQWLQQNFLLPLAFIRKNSSAFQCKQSEFIKQRLEKLDRQNKDGKLVTRYIYNVLQNHDSNYAQMIKNQSETFKKFLNTPFRQGIKNHGIEWLIENIQQIKTKPEIKKNLISKYQMYNNQKNKIIKKYQYDSMKGQKQMEDSKIQIIQSALLLAETLQKSSNNKNALSESKVKLLAYIFSIWMILTSDLNEQYQLQFIYEPHPAQICALLFLLNIVPLQQRSKGIQNCLVQVPTGQGKSVVLAGLSSYFALLGFEVYEACYSKYLSERDFKLFQNMFQALRIDNKIKYNTFSEVCKLILNQNPEQTFDSKVQSILLKKQSQNGGILNSILNVFKGSSNSNSKSKKVQAKKILLIDEADVFVNKAFIGQVYSPSINIKSSLIYNVLQYIWKSKDTDITPDKVYLTAQFVKLIKQYPQLTEILQNQVHGMIKGVKSFQEDTYTVKEDKIFYRQNDGLSAFVHHGYKTVFSYFYEHHVKNQISFESYQKNCAINLIYAHLSYTLLPSYFQNILGVTGTLNSMSTAQKNLLKTQYKVQKTVTMPSIYGIKSKRIVKFMKVNLSKRYQAFVNEIQRQHKKERPVIVFFQNKNELNAFFASPQFAKFKPNTCKITYQNNAAQRDFRIQTATFQNKITLLTDDFSRGTDFKFNMKENKDHEGLHVIQTFMPISESDYIQLIGRTARQGKNGSATIFKIINQQDQVFQKQQSLDNSIAVQMIKEEQDEYWNKEFSVIQNKIKQANSLHEQTVALYTKSKGSKEIIKKIYNWNQEPQMKTISIKTVIALDGTGSMGGAFPKVKEVLKEMFPRLNEVLKTRNANGSFEIKVIIYRNYSSGPDLIIESSNFENRPNVLVDFVSSINVSGGMGNQAIQICFQKINDLQKVDQIVIIGDAASNTNVQTINRRQGYGGNKWNQKGFTQTNIEKQTDLLIKKKIAVHSYYINADAYFKDLSKKTQGKNQKFDLNSKTASDQLTNFVSMIILQKMQKQGNGDGSLVKYYQQKYMSKVRHVS